MEKYNKPPKQNPQHPPPISVSNPPASRTPNHNPPTDSDGTDERGAVAFSLSDALEEHYGHIYTERQIKHAFHVRNVRDFFTREWARLREQAHRRYATSSRTCWYHKTSKTAHKCNRPCRYGAQTIFPRSAMENWPCLKHTIRIGAVTICRPPCPIRNPNARWNNRRTEPPPQ